MKEKPPKKTTTQNKNRKAGSKEMQKRSKATALSSDLSRVRKTQEYLDFLQLMATPSVLWPEFFGVKNQNEYAAKIGVEPATLSDWKNIPGYYDDVVRLNKQFFKARIGNVMLSLETKSLDPDKVSGQDVRVLATYAEAYSDRIEEEHKLEPAVQEALEKVARALD